MDMTAITLAKDNGFPLIVFNLNDEGAMAKAVSGQGNLYPGFALDFHSLAGLNVKKQRKTPMSDELLEDLELRMDGALENYKREMSGLRTGRANPALLDGIRVDAYGSPTPISQVGNVSVPEARMLSIQVWDATLAPAVEKAIRESDLGLNPSGEGTLIRIPLPDLTEERRRDLVKVAGRFAEESRVAVRNVRRDGMDKAKKMEKDSEISQDELKGLSDKIQKLTDAHIKQIDDQLASKESDIMQV